MAWGTAAVAGKEVGAGGKEGGAVDCGGRVPGVMAAAARMAAAPTPAPAVPECPEKAHEAAKAIRKGFKRPAAWVLVFGWSLAMCAGIVNCVAFRSWGVFVSHVTGATTNVGMRIEGYHIRGETAEQLFQTIFSLVAFFLGAYCCGLLIDKNHLHFGGKALYGAALLGNSALLVVATALSPHPYAIYFAAMACGLQNAMCTSHFGAIVRTTHVTGTLTDIGSTCGRLTVLFLRARGRLSNMNPIQRAEVGVDARKLLVLVPLWVSFLLGSIIGAYLFGPFGDTAFLFPAGITGTVGLLYMCFRQTLKDQIRKMERERLARDLQSVEQALQRTHCFMHAMQEREHSAGEAHCAVVELDEEVSHMLEVVHDVESALTDMYSRQNSNASAQASPKALVTRHPTI